MALRRTSGGLGMLYAPSVQHAIGPVCMTCGRIVDSEEIVEGEPGKTTHCKVLVKHHGAEELRTFDMGAVGWDHHDLGSLMRRTNWFAPEEGGMGLGKEVKVDWVSEAEPTRIYSGAGGGK